MQTRQSSESAIFEGMNLVIVQRPKKKIFQFTIQKLGRYAWWNFATKHFKICHKFWNTHFMLVWNFPSNKFLGPMIKLSSVYNHILSRPGQFIRGGKKCSTKWKMKETMQVCFTETFHQAKTLYFWRVCCLSLWNYGIIFIYLAHTVQLSS